MTQVLARNPLVVLCLLLVVVFMTCLIHVARGSDKPLGLQSDQPLFNQSIQTIRQDTATKGSSLLIKEQWEQCLREGEDPEFYLSIVLVTRMDNQTRNRYQQFQNFLDSTYLLAKHSEQRIELLFIEWNPPVGKRRVRDGFRFRKSKYLNHRFITIPPKIPGSSNPKYGPLSVSEGRNVGIHFARGQYVVFVNQDSIWSHNFINAIKSKVFEKDTIYLQAQHTHEIRGDLPSTIVDLGAFPDDATLHNACKLHGQDWGNYRILENSKLEKQWDDEDKVDDFALAHRNTWKDCIGYRASTQAARALAEFTLAVTSTCNKKLVYSKDMLTCHQKHVNESEIILKDNANSKYALAEDALKNQITGVSKDENWSLHPIDDWKKQLECFEFEINLG